MEIKPATIRKRIQYGRSKESAHTVPVTRKINRNMKNDTISRQVVYNRLFKGWDYERALTTPIQGRGGPRYKNQPHT